MKIHPRLFSRLVDILRLCVQKRAIGSCSWIERYSVRNFLRAYTFPSAICCGNASCLRRNTSCPWLTCDRLSGKRWMAMLTNLNDMLTACAEHIQPFKRSENVSYSLHRLANSNGRFMSAVALNFSDISLYN